MLKSVEVKVPATAANLGPGFDCLGVALDLWATVRLTSGHPQITIEGEGAEELPKGPDNLVSRAISRFFQETSEATPDLNLYCRNSIPLGRGLGSSAAAVVGGLFAANVLMDSPCTLNELLKLAVTIEGHPDNVAPALLGGCQIVAVDNDDVVTIPLPLAGDLRAVLFIPEQTIPTDRARSILPSKLPIKDVVFNLSRTALLVNALGTGNYEQLRIATQDRLHQPYRHELFPASRLFFRAALEAGALGVFLSGAGPTILALTTSREITIGYELAEVAEKAGIRGIIKVVELSNTGAHVVNKGLGENKGDGCRPEIWR